MIRAESEAAVSSVVGTVLLLAITVTVFGGVAVVVLDAVDDAPSRARSDVGVAAGDGGLYLRHLGGPALDPAQIQVRVTVDGASHDLDDAQRQELFGDLWRIGESTCLSCMFPAQSVEGVLIVHRNAALLNHGVLAGGGGGTGGGTGSTPDLVVDAVRAEPMVAGEPVTFDATIRNAGDAVSGAHTVRFEIADDTGSVVHSAGQSAFALAPGNTETVSTTWTAAEGDLTITVTADAGDVVDESDESNNAWTSGTFSPLPPGTTGIGFQDNDDDRVYTPGVDEEVAIKTLDAADCASGRCSAGDLGFVVTAAGAGLVFPAAAGPVTSDGAQDIYFEAPADVTLHADLDATADDAIAVRSLGGAVTSTSQWTTNGQGAIVVDAGGAVDLTGASLQIPGTTSTLDITAGAGATLSNAAVLSTGNNGGVAVSAGSGIVADGATLQGKKIDVTAPGTASIDQSGLSLLDRTGSPHSGATNTNLSCLVGTLAQGAWSTEAAAC